MTQYKAALIEKSGRVSQDIKFNGLKVFRVRDKVKNPKWLTLEGLQKIAYDCKFPTKYFPNAGNRVYELYVFSNDANSSFLILNGVTGLNYMFSLDEKKCNELVGKISARNELESLMNDKEREVNTCGRLEKLSALNKITMKKISAQKNKAEKNILDLQKLIDKESAKIKIILSSGWK